LITPLYILSLGAFHTNRFYSDSELVSHICASSRAYSGSRISIISPNLVFKQAVEPDADSELQGIQFAQQLGLRVPSVKRFIRGDGDVYIIITRICGRTMEAAWSTMTWLSTICVAFQLRCQVTIMHRRRSPKAGLLVTGQCNSI